MIVGGKRLVTLLMLLLALLMLLVTLLMSFMELPLKASFTSPFDKKPSPFLSMELKAACHEKVKWVFVFLLRVFINLEFQSYYSSLIIIMLKWCALFLRMSIKWWLGGERSACPWELPGLRLEGSWSLKSLFCQCACPLANHCKPWSPATIFLKVYKRHNNCPNLCIRIWYVARKGWKLCLVL